jgi:pectate lyase
VRSRCSNYYDTITTSGVNTRMGAIVLVESTTFVNT